MKGDVLEGAHLWRCKECSTVYTDRPLKRRCQVKGCHGRVAPFKDPRAPLDQKTDAISYGAKDISFIPMIQKVLATADALNFAAFKAEEAAEKLKQRNLAAGEEYVDSADFDVALFNLRAWLVLDMLTLRGMLHAAGLDSFVRPALLRLLDLRLRPAPEEPRVKVTLPAQLERRLTHIEEAVARKPTSEAPEVLPKRRKKRMKIRG